MSDIKSDGDTQQKKVRLTSKCHPNSGLHAYGTDGGVTLSCGQCGEPAFAASRPIRRTENVEVLPIEAATTEDDFE